MKVVTSRLSPSSGGLRGCLEDRLMLNREMVEIVEIDYRKGVVMLCARLLLAGVFLVSAYSRIMDWDGSVLFMISHGFGGFAQSLVVLSLACELLGGASLLLGFKMRAGSILLLCFLLGVTFTQNAFWLMPIDERAMQTAMFLKNLAIMGGLLMTACFGAGPFSVDNADERIETIASVRQSADNELISTR